jgi:hypothetical protein
VARFIHRDSQHPSTELLFLTLHRILFASHSYYSCKPPVKRYEGARIMEDFSFGGDIVV